MGISQCDDGNIISGDGCSSKCNIEDGFKCEGGNETNPDFCVEIIPPFMTSIDQNLLDLQIITIHFVEPVRFTGTIYIYIFINI